MRYINVYFMKGKIKELLFDLSPTLFGGLMAIRSRRVAQQFERRKGLPDLSRSLESRYGKEVRRGPFEGLILPDALFDRHVGPFLFGSYESCLHPFLHKLRENHYKSVIDIGSSFGYYAVGLARWFPNAMVHAFDTDPWARTQVLKTSQKNEVENIEVHTACTPDDLKEGKSCSLILSDCEGYEVDLFTKEVVESIKKSDVVVEVHPAGNREVRTTLQSRFEETHSTSVVGTESMEEKRRFLPKEAPLEALNEWRSRKQKWLICLADGSRST